METTGFPKTLKKFLPLFLLGFLFINGCANSLFYHPTRRMAPAPSTRGHAYEDVYFHSADGVELNGWWLPAEGQAKGTVVHFHGNAQNMSTHIQYAEWLPAAGYNLFVFDYRGYGNSKGSPSRKGLVRDGMAVLQTVSKRPEVDPERLFVWGQSLGGTVALQSIMRSEVPIRAAIIDSTFSSHGKIASDKMKQLPWFLQPVRLFRPLLISSSYNADEAVRNVPDLPILFIHGEQDRVIPSSHSQHLHELAPEHSQLWIIPDARHCDAVLRFPEQVRKRMIDFLQKSGSE